MRPAAGPRVDEDFWASALLSVDTELLLGAARNYLGPVRTPYDKREIVGRLTAFLRKPEVREAIVSLLDRLDARVLASLFLLGPIPEGELRSLFEGELPLFDLGIRIANLQDRLLVFRFEFGGRRLLAPNPVLAEDLEAAVMDRAAVFGLPEGQGQEPGSGRQPGPGQSLRAQDAVALFSFLFHTPSGIRKSGALTKKAQERAEAILPESLRLGGGRLAALLAAFDACGFLGVVSESREADPEAFGAALGAWGESLPVYLAAALASGADGGQAQAGSLALGPVAETSAALAAALSAALASGGEGFIFSRGGLCRWLEVALRRSLRGAEGGMAAGDLVDALLALGLVAERGGGFVVAPLPVVGSLSREGPGVVAEGSHAIHLLPEASLEERLLVGLLARPAAFGTVWSLEIDRESARRAFAAGLVAREAISRLSAGAGRALPQSLAFSLTAWEEEYRALRLYRGYVLVADERLRAVVEHSKALAPRIAERLAPGVFVLAASGPEEVAELLEEAGLEAPPEIHHVAPPAMSPVQAQLLPPQAAEGDGVGLEGSARARLGARAQAAAAPLEALARDSSRVLDPGPCLAALKSGLAVLGRQAELRELEDRIERRLVLTPRQLEVAELKPERMEATGLDYLGKVRIVERALRAAGDRLELLYRLPGGEPERVLARPTRLEKTEKGLVLEAENLATGEPVRVSLGAVSTVRRMRASLFGEDT